MARESRYDEAKETAGQVRRQAAKATGGEGTGEEARGGVDHGRPLLPVFEVGLADAEHLRGEFVGVMEGGRQARSSKGGFGACRMEFMLQGMPEFAPLLPLRVSAPILHETVHSRAGPPRAVLSSGPAHSTMHTSPSGRAPSVTGWEAVTVPPVPAACRAAGRAAGRSCLAA